MCTGGHRLQYTPSTHSQVSTKLSVELLEDPHEKEVNELAAMLDLRKVRDEPKSCKMGKMFSFFLRREIGEGGERWKGRETGRRQGESASGLFYGIGWLDLH